MVIAPARDRKGDEVRLNREWGSCQPVRSRSRDFL